MVVSVVMVQRARLPMILQAVTCVQDGAGIVQRQEECTLYGAAFPGWASVRIKMRQKVLFDIAVPVNAGRARPLGF